MLPPDRWSLNLEVVSGAESGAEEILSRAETLPFLASCRVVVVREAERLSSSDKGKIVDYLQIHPLSHVCLIFLMAQIDRRSSFVRALQSLGKAISSDLTGAQEVKEWLQARARQKGKRLSPAAAGALCDLMGEDPNLLVGELEKIVLLVGEREEIRIEDVSAQAGKRVHHIFEVTNALGHGKADEALKAVRCLLEQGEEALGILGMLTRHFRLLSKAKELDAHRKSRGEIARELKIPPSYLGALLSHAASISWDALEGVLGDLLRADSLLKSEKPLGILVLERLILRTGQSKLVSERERALPERQRREPVA